MRSRITWMLCLVLLAGIQGCCTAKSDTASSGTQMTSSAQKVTLMDRLNDWDHWVRDHLW
jgi:uncharacterized protein YceK